MRELELQAAGRDLEQCGEENKPGESGAPVAQSGRGGGAALRRGAFAKGPVQKETSLCQGLQMGPKATAQS